MNAVGDGLEPGIEKYYMPTLLRECSGKACFAKCRDPSSKLAPLNKGIEKCFGILELVFKRGSTTTPVTLGLQKQPLHA